jgi:DNA-binding SARP family transcriptional activator
MVMVMVTEAEPMARDRALALHRQGLTPQAESLVRQAEAAYGGDFLEEDPYEDWAAGLREEARSTFVSVARALARPAEVVGDHDTAARYHHLRILAKDSWNAGAHLGLVEALERAGRHGEATRRCRAYIQRMEDIDVPMTACTAPR